MFKQCIHQFFEAQVARTPQAIAVVFGQKQLTYEELNIQANQLADHLRSLGIGAEVLVGICVDRSLEMIVGYALPLHGTRRPLCGFWSR
ncbi:amino acid adenylation domain-containing protein (plasmid) [Scytonema sp. HK-05]|uniref:AMP-binding protein n=1 Tax=Scytonema sp. HK-05 TaxID=1137095 RepID=UPI0009377E10|nr:AMP-binding protein [Scytonema sp. HK-05]OKH54677.1 hypothetical protein NIES2130_28060 [Scytonema sp. HK-05]BAY50327.1 amino acid adenylation domain-containing protein [Scytonema sp. HK-05]